jgi:hypothetical protein
MSGKGDRTLPVSVKVDLNPQACLNQMCRHRYIYSLGLVGSAAASFSRMRAGSMGRRGSDAMRRCHALLAPYNVSVRERERARESESEKERQ